MTRYVATVCILGGALSVSTPAVFAQTRTVTGSPVIADTITALFAGIAEATSALDVDRLLGYYAETPSLTYVARGQVLRSRPAFREVLEAQLGGLAGAHVRWLDTYIDVLSDGAAVATATYELTATFPDGGTVRRTGTYMCIYVRRDGRWSVEYSSHTFPPTPD